AIRPRHAAGRAGGGTAARAAGGAGLPGAGRGDGRVLDAGDGSADRLTATATATATAGRGSAYRGRPAAGPPGGPTRCAPGLPACPGLGSSRRLPARHLGLVGLRGGGGRGLPARWACRALSPGRGWSRLAGWGEGSLVGLPRSFPVPDRDLGSD